MASLRDPSELLRLADVVRKRWAWDVAKREFPADPFSANALLCPVVELGEDVSLGALLRWRTLVRTGSGGAVGCNPVGTNDGKA